jgi:hypothetical protein
MPRYAIVAHLAHELDCDSAEEAAAVVRRGLPAAADGAALRHLAVWRLEAEPTSWPVPAALGQRLADFFGEVERYAAGAEEVFRARVEEVLADEPADTIPAPAARRGAADAAAAASAAARVRTRRGG